MGNRRLDKLRDVLLVSRGVTVPVHDRVLGAHGPNGAVDAVLIQVGLSLAAAAWQVY